MQAFDTSGTNLKQM